MKNRFVLGLMTAVMSVAVLVTAVSPSLADDQSDQGPAVATGDPDGSIAMAERMATYAHQILRQEHLPAKALDLSAALYEAAMKLDPSESRFPRALADICFELKDDTRAIKTLQAYLNLEPGDQTAYVQLLDLYLASPAMQSVDQRLNYLRGKLQFQQIPGPVRSEMAYRCAKLYLERSQTDQAIRMLDSARQLNPTNLAALRMRYIMTQEDATPIDRVQQLLGLMQANPADPVVASRLAEQLAELGIVEPSISWYGLASKLYGSTGQHPDPAFALGATSELLLGNHPDEAAGLISQYLQVLPDDANGWFLQLCVAKIQLALDPADQSMQTAYANMIKKASIAMINRLQEVRKVAGDSTATTRPVDSDLVSPLPDISGDAAMLKTDRNAQLVSPYVASISSLAWLDLYYSHDGVAADPLISVLAQLVPADDVTLRRLKAWRLYVGGDAAGAETKLRALAKDDALAAMGVIMIDAGDSAKKAHVPIDAQKLLDEHPAGVIGAVLWAELSQYHVQVEPSPGAGSVATLVANVPDQFLALVTQPKTYYQVEVTPLKPTFDFGEPVLLRVTLQNVSDVDLAIGDDAAIHPQLWFDAFLRGISDKPIPGAAIGRLDQRLVLGPGDMVSTVVRIDQDSLYPYFHDNPSIDLTANISLVTNPTEVRKGAGANQPGQAVPGLCGYSIRATDLVARNPIPIETDAQREVLLGKLESGDAGDKIRVMQAMATYVGILKTVQDPGAVTVIKSFMGILKKVSPSESPCLLAWHRMLLAQLAGDSEMAQLTDMAGNANWVMRLLALETARQSMGAKAIPLAQQLSTDENAIVREYAVAMAQSLQQIAATQPSDTGSAAAPAPPAGDNTAPPPSDSAAPPVGNATQ